MLAAIAVVTVAACSDDLLAPDEDPTGNPNAIAFNAYANAAQEETRGEKELFEPLVVSSTDGSHLYLHTYESEKIGFSPEDVSGSEAETRGVQVTSVEGLIKYNKDFMVHSSYKDDNGEYIEWANTYPVSAGSDVWRTRETRYWPAERELSFHAVSPSQEFGNLTDVNYTPNRFEFSYSARTGISDRDAEAQPDLLVATSTCNKSGSVKGKAPLHFGHALSAVKFAIRDVLGGEIVNIKIAGVNGSADCVYTASDDSQSGKFEWTNQHDIKTYSQNFNYKVNDRIVDPSDESQDILMNQSMPEKTFMMIPQQIPDNAEIIVTLKRTGLTPEQVTLRGKIKANNVQEWKPGHEYIYTISSSKDNWVYVFSATGNHDSKKNVYRPANDKDADQIYIYSPSKNEHDLYQDDAYFKVISYRYRANNQKYIEDLPWKATNTKGEQYQNGKYVPGHDVSATDWLLTQDNLRGEGNHSATGERKDISFAAHHQMTTWKGDDWMQSQEAYPNNSKDNPWDLSTCAGAVTKGGISRNTANCYVIDRQGWYCFPLVYGNGITGGKDLGRTYKDESSGGTRLATFKNHLSSGTITSAKINNAYCKGADMVWADVYNAISDIELVTIGTEKMIRFHANQSNLQQGNVVIALYDNEKTSVGNVVWSWHIWITEHWLDTVQGRSNKFKDDAQFSTFHPSQTGRRMRGDLLINNQYVGSSYGYYIAPYNIGWCDPKNRDYLKRTGDLNFVQYQKNGASETGKTAQLPILQDGERISYMFGNNTYYQWGRKDPIVGFKDHSSTVKRNFGPKKYEVESRQASGLYEGITRPQAMFTHGDNWIKDNYENLWNNSSSADKPHKTVYDPCPPGYMVPPDYMYRFVGHADDHVYNDKGYQIADWWNNSGSTSQLKYYNGKIEDDYTFQACINDVSKVTQNNDNTVWLTSTGNRWWKDGTSINGTTFNAGDNFNPGIVYLWTCTPHPGGNMGFGLALGLDAFDENKGNLYVITPRFNGRKTMARPVRPIREI